jgi:hypothetical protein
MYDLIITLWGNSQVLETGLALEHCNAMVAWLYETAVSHPDTILTCEAPL